MSRSVGRVMKFVRARRSARGRACDARGTARAAACGRTCAWSTTVFANRRRFPIIGGWAQPAPRSAPAIVRFAKRADAAAPRAGSGRTLGVTRSARRGSAGAWPGRPARPRAARARRDAPSRRGTVASPAEQHGTRCRRTSSTTSRGDAWRAISAPPMMQTDAALAAVARARPPRRRRRDELEAGAAALERLARAGGHHEARTSLEDRRRPMDPRRRRTCDVRARTRPSCRTSGRRRSSISSGAGIARPRRSVARVEHRPFRGWSPCRCRDPLVHALAVDAERMSRLTPGAAVKPSSVIVISRKTCDMASGLRGHVPLVGTVVDGERADERVGRRCSMMCAVQPVTRLATNSGVKVGCRSPSGGRPGPVG